MSTDGQGTKCRRNIAEKNIAENFNRLSSLGARALQTDDRQTGDSNCERVHIR